jgi:hypothetical protein
MRGNRFIKLVKEINAAVSQSAKAINSAGITYSKGDKKE